MSWNANRKCCHSIIAKKKWERSTIEENEIEINGKKAKIKSRTHKTTIEKKIRRSREM